MPMSMVKRQQALCCRTGCGKRPTRSIPSSLFRGKRTKVCKACYTWMRRHFQVEPNGKHVRCAEAGILDRCAAMLEDFAKAGVYPSIPASRNPRLVLAASNRYSCDSAGARHTHAHAQTSTHAYAQTTPHVHTHVGSQAAAHHPPPAHDGLTAQHVTPGHVPAAEWVEVEFEELSDSDGDCPELELEPQSSSVDEAAAESDCDMDAQSQATPWDGSVLDQDHLDFDALSTSSMNAWRELVVDDGTKSVDWDLESEDYDTVWQTSAPMHMPVSPCLGYEAQPYLPMTTLFPNGVTPVSQCAPAPAHAARSVTPIRCPRGSSGASVARRRACHVSVCGGRGATASTPPCVGGPSPTYTYAQDVRVAACGSARAMHVDRSLTPPRAPVRVASTDSLFSCGGLSSVSGDAFAAGGVPPKPQRGYLGLHAEGELAAVASGVRSRKYGRRKASAGVGFAVAAASAGDASPVDVHISG